MAAKPGIKSGVKSGKRTRRHHGAPSVFQRPDLYIPRDISLVEFTARVLAEAQSKRHPLLERVKFLAFVSSQLDEIMMIRVAGLLDQVDAQVSDAGPDGMLPGEQLDAVLPRIHELLREQWRTLRDDVLPRLAEAGVEVLEYDALTATQRAAAAAYFRSEILPVLTPLGVDPGHPFPHISNRSLNLAVALHDPVAGELFARIKVPATLRRLVAVPPVTRRNAANHDRPRRYTFTWIEQLIAAHLDELFTGMRVTSASTFRVLRDADIEIQIDEAGDLLATVEQGVRRQRFGSVVNLTVEPSMPERVRKLIRENLDLAPSLIWQLDGPLGLSDLSELTEIDRPDLKDPPLVARVPPEIVHAPDPFSAIRHRDLLLHHPYDAFSSVADFIEAAARDPHVLAIKQTLYRVGRNSPVVAALLEAADSGKQVAVLVELKARFDEENNIEWARTLERAGVHVVYGQPNLKTHAKLALVVRRESSGLKRYVHLGTGNYNASTARGYEDFALLTTRADIANDVAALFNALTGYARGVTYSKLLISPGSMRADLLARIEREIERHQATGCGRLLFKTNALVDPPLIQALYRASAAGVSVDLIVRGTCCLRPGVPGVSEHIRVRSIVGRFLEHSRVYYFANGGEGADEIWLGSADLMPRNLDNRIEVLFPLEERALRDYIVQRALPAYLRDTANTWELLPDGRYERVQPAPGEAPFDVQRWFAQEGALPEAAEAQLALHTPVSPLD